VAAPRLQEFSTVDCNFLRVIALLVSLVIVVGSLIGLFLISTWKEKVRDQLLDRIVWVLLGLTSILALLTA